MIDLRAIATQDSLLCGCGSADLFRASRCRRCERRERLSREMFGGLREEALRRDGYQCRVCGNLNPAKLLVHHRRPGSDRLADLITLCRKCHVRVHRTWRPAFWFASLALLRRLWRETNADLKEQRLLALLGEREERAAQAELFEVPNSSVPPAA